MERLTAEDQLMLWPDEIWPQEIGALAVLDGGGLLEPGGRVRIEAVRQPDTDRLISDGERSAVQEPEIPDVHLAVQIFETTATENPSGVAAGS